MAFKSSRTEAQRSFSNIPGVKMPRSTFNRSCGHKTTFMGNLLIPIFVDDVLPGDTVSMRMASVARMSTLFEPIMDQVFLDYHFWSVPNRLVWDNWVRMMGEQTDPGDSTDYTVPTFDMTGKSFAEASLHDYMGLPIGVSNLGVNSEVGISSLYARAYYLIWNEWYRDENLQDSLTVPKGDAQDNPDSFVIQKRGKRKDYITAGLPWPQKGDAVTLPLGTSAPVTMDGSLGTDASVMSSVSGVAQKLDSKDTLGDFVNLSTTTGATAPAAQPLYADLSNAASATINTIREAFQQQKVYERDARGGTRYVEHLHSHFGVTHPAHYILQRPEYLGGGTVPMGVQQVPQTAGSWSGSNQKVPGDMGAYGKAVDNNVTFNKSFLEHGMIIGLVSARADLTYQQGVERHFTRSTRWDFYLPALAHLGEQEIRNIELYAQGTAADDDPFAYQERWAEYRYKPSRVSGAFRSTAATPLDVWHLAEEFTALPVLNASFIESNSPFGRVLVTGDLEPHFILDTYFNFRHTRPMPTYSVPGMLDHF